MGQEYNRSKDILGPLVEVPQREESKRKLILDAEESSSNLTNITLKMRHTSDVLNRNNTSVSESNRKKSGAYNEDVPNNESGCSKKLWRPY